VKARNPHLSVCQLGATIGRMWRELTEDEKRKHLEDFHQDKVLFTSSDSDTAVQASSRQKCKVSLGVPWWL